MTIGIYKIENKINGKIYIGQSINIKARLRSHICSAYNQNKKNDYDLVIHKAIRKYGADNFSYEIIEECPKEKLNEREEYWIVYYDSYYNGYNSTKGGDNYDHLGKPVELYDYDGNYVMTIKSATDVAKYLGISRAVVYQVLYGQRKSCKNYQLKYKDDDKKIITKYKNRQGGKIPVVQLDKYGNLIQEFESTYAAARELDLDASAITKCCRKKLKSCGGFHWKYKEEYEQELNS